jgi:ubiquinone/menaquinone biosynthesis C-methylase UbiE
VDYDDPALSAGYREGREHPPETRRLWAEAMARWLPRSGARRALDLGCGSGRFSLVLAEDLGLFVAAVDPSRRMLAEARAHGAHARVGYLRGAAERLPLRGGTCGFAWLSMVLHHLRDLDRAAAELARVQPAGGRVALRNVFRGRLDGICFFRFSPAAKRADEARMPSVERVERAFAACGYRTVALEEVRQVTDRTLEAHLERMRRRALSFFAFMTEEEIRAGLAALEEAVLRGREPGPVVETIDVLVLEKA